MASKPFASLSSNPTSDELAALIPWVKSSSKRGVNGIANGPSTDNVPTRSSAKPSPTSQDLEALLPARYRSKGSSKQSLNGISDGSWTKHELWPLYGPKQSALCIYAKGEYYRLKPDMHIPKSSNHNEALIQTLAIGLNPVDWKGADFGFGQPDYPWVNGRDFAGVVARAPDNPKSRIQQGDVVFGSSTDYRDKRKAAFQEYLIANDFNISRLPRAAGATINEVAALGTAWVASAVGLGICLGIDWSNLPNKDIPRGPNLLAMARQNSNSVPEDVRPEVMDGIATNELPQPGEWIVIWGGGGVTGQWFIQLAKLAGLRVACVDDLTAVGGILSKLGLDLMLDFKTSEPDRLVQILRAVTGGKLRFGVDTVGKKTAQELMKAVQPSSTGLKAHIIGLSGLPDDETPEIGKHAPPLKVLHELPECGHALSVWLEELVLAGSLIMPEIETAEGGLGGINDALDRLRNGAVAGKRIVVPIKQRQQRHGEELTNGA